MTRVCIMSVIFSLAALPIGAARAQTPDASDVAAQIQADAGPLAPCLLSIAAREDTTLYPWQPNLENSGAFGLFQIMPQTWASTPEGQRVPQAVASVAEQVAAAVQLIMGGWLSAWTPVPVACGG